MSRRTVDELTERDRRAFGLTGAHYVSADASGIHLIRSRALARHEGVSCLTHRVRYIHHGVLRGGSTYESVTSECGMLFRLNRVDIVATADEIFLCHACHAICEKHGIDHFNLVPNKGCESSGGRLGMNRRRPA